jgi:hypothetical protein
MIRGSVGAGPSPSLERRRFGGVAGEPDTVARREQRS